jgi:hypothetical protein
LVTQTIKKINQKDNTNNTNSKRGWKVATNIKNKLVENEYTKTKADRANTIVILTRENYLQKVNTCIQENQITVLNSNPMKNYQKTIKQTQTQCNIIPK